ncbi:uracil-DNA glycosylase [Candidatus Bathyarchaeota archaeon]|nr:uracil-DNA glycosylase [Candidatus Bathyarchaeota archaeon]
MKSKQLQFADLITRVRDCSLCSRMSRRKPVLSQSNGNLDSLVVFIAEAPGRLGADKFGIPLYGDQTGRNFEMLIASAGIRRESIFITNAVLCNPRTPDGNNDSPTLVEMRNCSIYLKETLEIIEPKYVVPLGAAALAALNIINPHQIKLSEGVGKLFSWNGFKIYPLFHPGPRAFIRRTKAKQLEDYRTLAGLGGKHGLRISNR